jgi:hypothetical protein
LKEPEFVEEESFTVTLWRNMPAENDDTPQVENLYIVEKQKNIDLRDIVRDTQSKNY